MGAGATWAERTTQLEAEKEIAATGLLTGQPTPAISLQQEWCIRSQDGPKVHKAGKIT